MREQIPSEIRRLAEANGGAMGKFDSMIKQLQENARKARGTLTELHFGAKTHRNDEDVTGERKNMAQRALDTCKQLIRAYKRRND